MTPNHGKISLAVLWVLLMAIGTGCESHAPATVGEPSPKLSVLNMADRPVHLAEYRGQVVVLRFWSATCAACVTEMPQIERIYQRYRDRGLAVLAVNMGQDKEAVRAFAREQEISYPVLLDELSITAKRYGVIAVPTSFVLDREGIVRDKILGEAKAETFEKKVMALL